MNGIEFEGVYRGAEFLREVKLGTAPPVEATAGVIGGGNLAIMWP